MSHTGEHPYIISRFFSRKLEGQKWMKLYIESAEKKPCQPKILYLAKPSFENEGLRLLDKQKLIEFITIRLVLQEMLNRGLQIEKTGW